MRTARLFVIAVSICGLGSAQKLCEINPLPADKDAVIALNEILQALHLPNIFFLYQSSVPLMKRYGGAAAIECTYGNGQQKWIVYDPALIKGDLALHFALAHELAHHQHNDVMSGEPRDEKQELDADRYAAEYLASPPLNWSKDRLLQALNALKLPPEAQGTHPSIDKRREQVIAGYERTHHPVVMTGGTDAGTISFLGCPDGTQALVDGNGESISKTPATGPLSLRQLGAGAHRVRLLHQNYVPREVTVTVDLSRHVQEPCDLKPDLEAQWNFPVTAVTPGMTDSCKYRLATSAASAVFHGQALDTPLILYGQLQKEQDTFQTCDFDTIIDADQFSTTGKVLLTFEYGDDGQRKERIATAAVSPNGDVSELSGRVTDLKSGFNAPVVLQRGYVLPMFSHCNIELKPRQPFDGLATIRVIVLDPTGAPLPGAQVFIKKQGAIRDDFAFEKGADIDGIRQVTATVGKYHLSVYAPGLGSEILDDVPVGADQQLEVRCELHRLHP